MIIVPKKMTYDTPEGNHRAVVRDAFEMQDRTLRIVFQILSLPHKFLIYLAGKNYPPGKQALADDLFEWLGIEKMQTMLNADGSLDIDKLKGLHADIHIVHIHNDDHEQPYAFVSKIKPAGTLTPDSQSDAA